MSWRLGSTYSQPSASAKGKKGRWEKILLSSFPTIFFLLSAAVERLSYPRLLHVPTSSFSLGKEKSEVIVDVRSKIH